MRSAALTPKGRWAASTVSLPRVAVGATIGRGVRSSIKLLVNYSHISSPAGGVEGAAASSFIDRLRDGWRPCP